MAVAPLCKRRVELEKKGTHWQRGHCISLFVLQKVNEWLDSKLLCLCRWDRPLQQRDLDAVSPAAQVKGEICKHVSLVARILVSAARPDQPHLLIIICSLCWDTNHYSLLVGYLLCQCAKKKTLQKTVKAWCNGHVFNKRCQKAFLSWWAEIRKPGQVSKESGNNILSIAAVDSALKTSLCSNFTNANKKYKLWGFFSLSLFTEGDCVPVASSSICLCLCASVWKTVLETLCD